MNLSLLQTLTFHFVWPHCAWGVWASLKIIAKFIKSLIILCQSNTVKGKSKPFNHWLMWSQPHIHDMQDVLLSPDGPAEAWRSCTSCSRTIAEATWSLIFFPKIMLYIHVLLQFTNLVGLHYFHLISLLTYSRGPAPTTSCLPSLSSEKLESIIFRILFTS